MATNQVGVMGSSWKSGVLANATPVAVAITGAPVPATVYLTSADAGRKIEFSVDGGTTYNVANYDYSPSGQLVAFFSGSVTHLRFTGASAGGDAWGVL